MSTPILSTKLYLPPQRPDLMPRPRLIERLNGELDQRPGLILVSAPAGFGKTTLICEWLRQSDLLAAWISLDETDNDPSRFLTYLSAALRQVDPTIDQIELGIFQPSPSTSPEVLLTALINDIAATSSPFLLVLDDYHLIEAQPIHAALTFLLEHLPAQLTVVITCRADPPFPLARWRGRGQLTELREADLRFTSKEAGAYLKEISGLNLSAAQVGALASRTEGWITGLHLAALSLQNHDDIAGFVHDFTGSHRYILDYLTDEVLSRQPEVVQHFLVQTSILDRLSGSLCDAVLGRGTRKQGSQGEIPPAPLSPCFSAHRPVASSQETLEYLEQTNLFIVSLDDERRWYRYHHLFTDLLRHRLRQIFPDQIPTLHRRAGEWYEQHDLPPEAVGHLLAAEEFERAAVLVERIGWEMLTRGEMVMLLSWLDKLPGELVHSRPQLQIFQAWALALTGRLDAAETHLQESDPEGLSGEVAAVRAYMAFLQQDSHAVELSRRALELLPEENFVLRALMALSLGTAIFWALGEPVSAAQTLTKAVRLARASGDHYLVLSAVSTLGFTQEMRGQLHRAAETYRQALQLATPSSQLEEDRGCKHAPPFAGLAHLGLAELLYEWNDLAGAERHARLGIDMGERSQSIDILQGGCSYLIMAQINLAKGEVDEAMALIRKAEQFAQVHSQAYVVALTAAVRARLWLARGNVTAASRWARERGLGANDDLNYARETEYITLARLLVVQGHTDESLGLLARLLAAAQAAERIGSALKILVLTTLAFQALGDEEQALSTLKKALTLAEPEGYVRTFIDEGEPLAELLRRASTEGITPNYVARLLVTFGQEAESTTTSAIESLVEPLSERELEVLRLVAAGLSNREIAEELFLSINTVKVHTKNIYGKLSVRGRIQAVERARELGLL